MGFFFGLSFRMLAHTYVEKERAKDVIHQQSKKSWWAFGWYCVMTCFFFQNISFAFCLSMLIVCSLFMDFHLKRKKSFLLLYGQGQWIRWEQQKEQGTHRRWLEASEWDYWLWGRKAVANASRCRSTQHGSFSGRNWNETQWDPIVIWR